METIVRVLIVLAMHLIHPCKSLYCRRCHARSHRACRLVSQQDKLIYQSPRRHFRRRRVQHGHAHQTTIKPHYQTFRQGTASGTVERGVFRPIQVAVTLVNSDLCDECNKARSHSPSFSCDLAILSACYLSPISPFSTGTLSCRWPIPTISCHYLAEFLLPR